MKNDTYQQELFIKSKDAPFCFVVEEVRKIKGVGPCAFGYVKSGMAFDNAHLYRNSLNLDTLKMNVYAIDGLKNRKNDGWLYTGEKAILRLPYPNGANVEAGDKLVQISYFIKK